MAAPSCPSCGELIHSLETRASGSVAYCEACGWNVAGAIGCRSPFQEWLLLARHCQLTPSPLLHNQSYVTWGPLLLD